MAEGAVVTVLTVLTVGVVKGIDVAVVAVDTGAVVTAVSYTHLTLPTILRV